MIKGITLQNFMSYDHAYVPLEPGLNLICGPNGAGKSSILLAISVVLGQTYTERAKRLSDLIRRGQDQARITIQFDNGPRQGRRPFPQYHLNTVNVTRILKRTGDYTYLIQNRPVSRASVLEAFNKFGLNPDNMLIIMHQLMVGRFSSITAHEKLQMLEEAVGFESYRTDVLDAYRRLGQVSSEEETVANLLQSTQETYDYWKREYEKYQRKKVFESKLRELQRELLWAKVEKKEAAVSRIESRIDRLKLLLENSNTKVSEAKAEREKHSQELVSLQEKMETLRGNQLTETRNVAINQTNLDWISKLTKLDETNNSSTVVRSALTQSVDEAQTTPSEKLQLQELRMTALRGLDESTQKLESINKEIVRLAGEVENELSSVVDFRVRAEVEFFKTGLLNEQIAHLEAELVAALEELEPVRTEAENVGPRIKTSRKNLDIMNEINVIQEQLKPYVNVSEDVEKMFTSYTGVLQDLKEKAELVKRNRQEVLKELDKRREKWKEVVETFLGQLSARYSTLLAEVGGNGAVKLVSAQDIDKAGIDLLVGFKGSTPMPLDSFTQSGGERSVALMAFLLSLQQYVTCPFRGIDEFDVHMDPKNRELISKLIVSSFSRTRSEQYLAITPGQVLIKDDDMHVIVVQNVEGKSMVSEMKRND
jgi:chromosome segregation ATPase